MTTLTDLLFHLDDLLDQLVAIHPLAAYLTFFCLVFCESAFFPLAPVLPGDGLLFSIGVMGASGLINLGFAIPVLILGGVTGNWVAFFWGQKFGLLLFDRYSWLNRKQFDRAHEFYQRHGSKAFLISRYVPIVRALVPFVAGVAQMDRLVFRKYNWLSVSLWVCTITLVSFFLGHLPFVKHHFTWIIFGTFGLSMLLLLAVAARELLKRRFAK